MDESKEEMNTGHSKIVLNPFAVRKPKKRSLVERELETNMTARITSPVTDADGVNTSRYGRARRIKTRNDILDTLKSPKSENTPVKTQSSIPKAVNLYKTETPKKALRISSDNNGNTFRNDKSLSRFNNPQLLPISPSGKSKVYIRTDLIQNRDDDDDDVILIKDLFSPKSGKKRKMLSTDKLNSSYTKQNGHIVNASVVKALDFDSKNRDSGSKRADFGDKKKASDIGSRNASDGSKKAVVSNKRNSSGNRKSSEGNKKDSIDNKIGSESNKRVSLDNNSDINKRHTGGNKGDSNNRNTDCNKGDSESNKNNSDGNKKRESTVTRSTFKKELSDVESTCLYQVGDLAWARMGTFPFWPCIITRDPESEMFVRKKLFGRVEHYILHVTFFADNGRRSWVVDNMLRKYMGLEEFLSAREKFTLEAKKRDPRLYSAFFISEKKQSLWNTSVEEAETLNHEPRALRIGIFNNMLYQARASKRQQRSGKVTRTDSDVSLSESLYDTLFCENDSKTDDSIRLRNKSKNRSLDVSDVVTACLDNMAAKTGNIKIQRQSHMDRWLQKAKSKTPEKVKNKVEHALPVTPVIIPKQEVITPVKVNQADKVTPNVEKVVLKAEKPVSNNKKKKHPPKEIKITKVYSLRRSYESQNALIVESENKITESNVDIKAVDKDKTVKNIEKINSNNFTNKNRATKASLDTKTEQLKTKTIKYTKEDGDLKAIDELLEGSSTADNNNLPSKPLGEGFKEKRVEKLTDQNQHIKPEVMDVDQSQENITQDTITEILDSPVKTEKESGVDDKLVNESQVEFNCNRIIEGFSIETESTAEVYIKTPDDNELKIKRSDLLNECYLRTSDDHETNNALNETSLQTSPTLKPNEMVSIPENLNMTDDESNSMTSLECNSDMTNLQDYSSNLTIVSAKANCDMTDLSEKKLDKNIADVKSIENPHIFIENTNVTIENPVVCQTESTDLPNKNVDLTIENNDISVDEMKDNDNNEKDLLNDNSHSTSILGIDKNDINYFICKSKETEESACLLLNNNEHAESVLNSKNETLEVNSSAISDDNTVLSKNESNPFFGNSQSIVDYKDTILKKVFFREVNINKPPDLTTESVAARADYNNDSEYEDSEDEPSPEYEPLGDEITEDFRQHMKCIENSITDKKDEAQLVKICNEIAMIEESKFKLSDIKTDMNTISPNSSMADGNVSLLEAQRIVKEERIKSESLSKTINGEMKSEKIVYEETTQIDLTKTLDEDLSKDIKAEILDGLNIINKAAKNHLKSSPDKKKHKLSLKRDKSNFEKNIKTENITMNDTTINPRYKTIDQIEEIMKRKPKRLPIENGEVSIPEIKENGHHRENDTPDRCDDDFDIDEASVNSEDSEISLHQEKIPARRSLRARPCRKSGLEDPEFLAYMELRQDDLMEQYPDLSIDDIVLYLYKTFAYTQSLKSDVILDESPTLKTVKQETSPSRKKSKKTQPKNTIENFFREKYNNAKKNNFESERSESTYTSDSNDYIKHKRHISISPVDSGIGNSNSNESNSSVQRKTKSKLSQNNSTEDITKDVKVELMNDIEHEVSPKTPKRLRKKIFSRRVLEIATSKISPKAFENSIDKRIPVVVISPIKKERIETYKHDTRTKLKLDTETIQLDKYTKKEQIMDTKPVLGLGICEPIIDTKPILDSEITRPIRDTIPVPVTDKHEKEDVPISHVAITQTKYVTITEAKHEPIIETKNELETEEKEQPTIETKRELIIETKQEMDVETESLDSDSELPLRQLRTKVLQENKLNELKKEILELKQEIEDTTSISSDNEPLLKLRPKKVDKSIEGSYEDPDFLKYVELKQDNIIDENPQLSQNEIKAYLYKTWIYEKNSKSDMQKNDDIQSSNLVKGLNQESAPTRKKRKTKTEKLVDTEEFIAKDKPKRKTVSHYYNEAFLSDIEDELEVFEIFKTKKAPLTVVSKPASPKKEVITESKTDEELNTTEEVCEEINTLDDIELYFKQLTSPKPSVFKGLIREKVCEVCEDISNLIKCKGCSGMFHYDCVNKTIKVIETPTVCKGRRKKMKKSRKLRNMDDSDHSDDRDISEENISMEETTPESITIDAATIEALIEAKMKEILDKETQINYDSYSSDDGIDWTETVPGKCELIDVKLKRRAPPIDYTNFRCNNCQKHDTPICFVCKSAVSKTGVKIRQKCNVVHCHSYYHLECLNHWPQTQFNAGEWTRSKKSEQFEALTCPRHVCHTCVSDDPRGCKTRFSGDKLAKCVRCPATYHSFNKCLPAGTQILTASLIICPRHYEHRPGKVPCHVNTGWCFICALGGSLICCEYCPTSFHAECLNIKPPEGNYMCEDCETGRLPLYGEMVWVKLGHYRWWPGVILHPSEIPDNIMAVKHGLGEFVVRFFGQYDHYWVNRGRVFPYQEGDSGRISSQKSKIDVAFTTAMKHAQRAFEILKKAKPDEEECQDIASSLLPPHYVKLKCNKPIGSLLGRKVEDPSLSLTQCECSPAEAEPCGPNSQCINRMLLTECGPTCRAGDRCNNRAFEKRLYPRLTPYRASHRGWGLKTLEDIKAGQFVIEYVGELIDEEEFQRRMRRQHEIRDENFYFLTLDKERMIDAGPKGNLARFMNHCCEPNCETQKWTVLGDVRVGLFAIDDIKANSEVTFNYNLECSGIEKKRCLCGAERCSGYIGAKPKQLDESRKKNGMAKRKYTKRKNIESPSTKSKVKKPVGRPPKPKELTEIEKDLLIIKNATISSDESSSQMNIDSVISREASIPTESKMKLENTSKESSKENQTTTMSKESKIDSKIMEEMPVLNKREHIEAKTLKRKLDLKSAAVEGILSEPSAKRQKCDKIDVGD